MDEFSTLTYPWMGATYKGGRPGQTVVQPNHSSHEGNRASQNHSKEHYSTCPSSRVDKVGSHHLNTIITTSSCPCRRHAIIKLG